MLNEESSTAALIPFDRVFYLTAAELNEDYRVNLFSRIKRENSELLGMFGEPPEASASEEEEEEAEAEASEDENGEDSNVKKEGKKQKRKIMKKAKELEYDLDDPFIDDSEITDIYQSVFELMRSGRHNDEEDYNEDNEETDDSKKKKHTVAKVNPKPNRNFFVYRGTMTPEILSKEFEIDVNDLMEVEAAASNEATENASESEDESGKKNKSKNKRIRTATMAKGEEKPIKKTKIQKAPKPAKVKPPKPTKVNDLISQSAKKFNDIFSTDDTPANATVPVFNVTGVDANLLELREVLKRFRDSAVGTPFSPGKFPSVLRPKLNETLCAMLRCSRPSLQSPLPARFFPALASFLPFTSAALNKLLSRKILGPLIESMERNEIPKLYTTWEVTLANRIKEDGSIIIVNTITTEDPAATAQVSAPPNTQISAQAPAQTPTQSLKKKLKFNDEMRQIIFEILRTEIDVNNLIILSNTFDATSSNSEIPKVAQSELNLRKIVYQKLANQAVLPDDPVPLLSSTEISKEFGAQKRKHEKKIAKASSEILFGEMEIEEFLKELDVPKEAVKVAVVQGESVVNAPQPDDPLKLFGNEPAAENTENSASNTSLFMETTN